MENKNMTNMEVVYAIHEFIAENKDEISLHVGEKVIVLEKDEGFDDGWWQGRNEKGDIGLFPTTYTSKTLENMKPTRHISITSKNNQSIIQQSLTNPLLHGAIEEWSSEQVAYWLVQIGFEQDIADNFKDQEITGDILLQLDLDSLKELQISTFGKRFKIHHAIHTLKGISEKHIIQSSPRLSSLLDNDRQSQQQQQDTVNGKISSRYSFNKLQSILTPPSTPPPATPLPAIPSLPQPPPPSSSIIHATTTTIPQKQQQPLRVSISDSTIHTPDTPEIEGWLYKQGDKYKNWNKRWFVLKSNNLFYFKSPKATRMKGIIHLKGYRIEVDETIQPGKYCFMAQHDKERTFYFYTEHEKSMKEWLKALMKATIARDFATPVMSSSTVPTVSLEQARRMRPRPPSAIFQPRHSQSSLSQHFSLMSIPENKSSSSSNNSSPRSSRHSDYSMKDSGYGGRLSRSMTSISDSTYSRHKTVDEEYVDWINTYLHHKIQRLSDLSSGQVLLEFLENLTQKRIPGMNGSTPQTQNLDCIISAYKFMSIEGIDLNGACTIRDVANGNEVKILHLLETIKSWYHRV